jgi:hypothetical protein
MKPQRQIANETPHGAVTMKPEDILTPDQLGQRLQVKRSWVYEKLSASWEVQRGTDSLPEDRKVLALLLAGHQCMDANW